MQGIYKVLVQMNITLYGECFLGDGGVINKDSVIISGFEYMMPKGVSIILRGCPVSVNEYTLCFLYYLLY